MEQLSPVQLAAKLRNRAGSIGLAPTPVIPTGLGTLRRKYRVISSGIAVDATNSQDTTQYRFDAATAPSAIVVGDTISGEVVYFPVISSSSIRFEERKS
jgi:hypothetical protein